MRTLVVLALLLAVALAARRIHHTTARWIAVEEVAPTTPISFVVALKQRNLDALEKFVLDVSDPKSPNYGRHKTREQISIEDLGDALRVKASAACVYNLFGVRMMKYRHEREGYEVIRQETTRAIEIPEEIREPDFALHFMWPDAEDVEMVTGLNEFPVIRKTKRTPISSLVDDSVELQQFYYVIPKNVRAVYNIPDGKQCTSPKSSQSVVEFTPIGAPLVSDMRSFATLADEKPINISRTIGPWIENGYADESTLDIEYIATVGSNCPNTYITIKDGWIYEMALTIFNTPNPPLVNSVSYGWPEALSCQSSVTNANCTGTNSEGYVQRSETELQKLGGLGVTVVVCSQDEGAPSEANEECQYDSSNEPVWPVYPGSSAWVTTVSGTTLIDTETPPHSSVPICNKGFTCANGTLEYACMTNNTYYKYTTGGGFSNYTAMPSWQQSIVQKYLSSNPILPPSYAFNPHNRGYPDVSAFGARVLVVMDGQVQIEEGTSAATPIFASVVSLLNDWRLANGKSPLGFINPLLYQMAAERPTAFNDVSVGLNRCTINMCCKYGYGAAPGWDAVTGLGTPNFGEMLNYIQSLP